MSEQTELEGNLEIQKALEEFEAKSAAEQAQKASQASQISQDEAGNIKYETDSYKAIESFNEITTPRMVKLVMKYSGGAIKKERQAEYILFGFVVIAVAISIYLFLSTGKPRPSATPEDLFLTPPPDTIKE